MGRVARSKAGDTQRDYFDYQQLNLGIGDSTRRDTSIKIVSL